jgi:hypothetical protein
MGDETAQTGHGEEQGLAFDRIPAVQESTLATSDGVGWANSCPRQTSRSARSDAE